MKILVNKIRPGTRNADLHHFLVEKFFGDKSVQGSVVYTAQGVESDSRVVKDGCDKVERRVYLSISQVVAGRRGRLSDISMYRGLLSLSKLLFESNDMIHDLIFHFGGCIGTSAGFSTKLLLNPLPQFFIFPSNVAFALFFIIHSIPFFKDPFGPLFQSESGHLS